MGGQDHVGKQALEYKLAREAVEQQVQHRPEHPDLDLETSNVRGATT
jgi:hypothetical protein